MQPAGTDMAKQTLCQDDGTEWVQADDDGELPASKDALAKQQPAFPVTLPCAGAAAPSHLESSDLVSAEHIDESQKSKAHDASRQSDYNLKEASDIWEAAQQKADQLPERALSAAAVAMSVALSAQHELEARRRALARQIEAESVRADLLLPAKAKAAGKFGPGWHTSAKAKSAAAKKCAAAAKAKSAASRGSDGGPPPSRKLSRLCASLVQQKPAEALRKPAAALTVLKRPPAAAELQRKPSAADLECVPEAHDSAPEDPAASHPSFRSTQSARCKSKLSNADDPQPSKLGKADDDQQPLAEHLAGVRESFAGSTRPKKAPLLYAWDTIKTEWSSPSNSIIGGYRVLRNLALARDPWLGPTQELQRQFWCHVIQSRDQ